MQSAPFAGQLLLLFALQKAGRPVLFGLLGAVGALTGVPVMILLLGEEAPAGLIYAAPLIVAGTVPVTWVDMRVRRKETA